MSAAPRGVDRARAMVEWWTGQGTVLVRLWAAVAFAIGIFLAYATTACRIYVVVTDFCEILEQQCFRCLCVAE
jgi:hypothetical protein